MEALTIGSEENKRRFFYAYKNNESNEKENKEWMDMFMMESGKKSRVGFGIHTKRKEKICKRI